VNNIYTDQDFKTIEHHRDLGIWSPDHYSSIGLAPYIKRLGNDIEGIEIGTGKGESAYLLLDRCPNIKKLYTIDPFSQWDNWNGTDTQEDQDRFKEIAHNNLLKFGSRVEILELSSAVCIAEDGFDQESMDFIFIDGDPSTESTMFDLANYYRLLKVKGMFAGHNFQFKTVYDAVQEFRKKYNINIPIQKSTNGTYFWYKV